MNKVEAVAMLDRWVEDWKRVGHSIDPDRGDRECDIRADSYWTASLIIRCIRE